VSREASPAIALLNQRLSNHRDTVIEKNSRVSIRFRRVLTICFGLVCAYLYFLVVCLAMQSVATACGAVGILSLLSLYVIACAFYLEIGGRTVWQKGCSIEFRYVTFLIFGSLYLACAFTVNALLGRLIDRSVTLFENCYVLHEWIKNPKHALRSAFDKHEEQYPCLRSSDRQIEKLSSAVATWKDWWHSFKKGEEDGSNRSDLPEMASELKSELELNIIPEANSLEPEVQKAFDLAQFQIDQIRRAQPIFSEPSELEWLVERMKLAQGKLSEAVRPLEVIADAQLLAIHLPELQQIVQAAENRSYLLRCEQAHDELNKLMSQSEQRLERGIFE